MPDAAGAQGRQGCTEHTDDAEGFLHQSAQLGIHEAFLVGPEAPHIADPLRNDQAGVMQSAQFPLCRSAAQSRQAHDLVQVKAFIHADKEQSQQFLLGGSK